jgi:transcription elongation factor GreA
MDKKNILTYQGLKKLEDELQDLKVVRRKEVVRKLHRRSKKQENREIFPRTLSMMQQKMSREISKLVSKILKKS